MRRVGIFAVGGSGRWIEREVQCWVKYECWEVRIGDDGMVVYMYAFMWIRGDDGPNWGM